MTPGWASRIRLGLPLLTKELTELAARRRTYIVRGLYAAALFVGFALFLGQIIDYRRGIMENLGRGKQIFEFLVGIQFVGIFALLPAMTAGVLTSEKERDSLVLLLVTDLGPWEIVLQKLLGRLVPMVTFLLLSLPLMTVAYAFGGMSADYVASGVWILLLTCFQVGAFALMMSAICRTTAQAFIASYAVGALFYLALPIFYLVMNAMDRVRIDDDVLGAFFPPYVFFEGARRGFGDVFLRSIPVIFSAALFLVLARVFLVRRAYLKPKDVTLRLFKTIDRFMTWANRITGGVLIVKDRTDLPGDEPVAWREVNKKALGKPHYLFRVLVAVEVPVVFLSAYMLVGDFSSSRADPLSAAAIVLWCLAILAIAVKSASSIVTERARQTMEVLLATPLEGHQIIRQKMKGMRRLAYVLAVPFLTIFAVEAFWESSEDLGVFTYLAASILTVIVYFPMFGWAAMWVGLRAKGRSRAVVTVVMALVCWCVVPFLLITVLALVMGTTPDRGGLAYLWITSPATIVYMTEFQEFGPFGGVPIVPIALNFLWHGGVLFFFRYLCLTHADRHLGRMTGGGQAAAGKATELAARARAEARAASREPVT